MQNIVYDVIDDLFMAFETFICNIAGYIKLYIHVLNVKHTQIISSLHRNILL